MGRPERRTPASESPLPAALQEDIVRRSALATTLLLAALDAGAATFVVGSTTDGADAVPGNGVCSWTAGICTLRAAIQEANAWPGADVIQLPAGTFALSIAGAGEDAAATGDLDIAEDLTIEGATAAGTVIDAGSLDRVFDVLGMPGTLSVTIRDVTIRGGAASDVPGAGVRHADDGTLTVEDSVFSQNQVSGTTSDAIGGAISSNGVGHLEVRRVLFSANGADRGGAIFHNGSLAIWDSTFAGNTASTGSAIESYGDGTVERCTFVGNQATAGSGAMIRLLSGTYRIQNSTSSDNESPGPGISAYADLRLESVTSLGNTTWTGLWVGGGTTSIVNSVLWGTSGDECNVTGGTIVSLGHNLDSDDTCGAGPGDLPIQDPQLAPLADNGGLTETHLPAPGSPLANAGLDAACLPEDQRGVLRNLGPANACDVGSVEFAVPEPGATGAGVAALGALALLRRRRRAPPRG